MKIYKQQDKEPLPDDIANAGDQRVPVEALPEGKQVKKPKDIDADATS